MPVVGLPLQARSSTAVVTMLLVGERAASPLPLVVTATSIIPATTTTIAIAITTMV